MSIVLPRETDFACSPKRDGGKLTSRLSFSLSSLQNESIHRFSSLCSIALYRGSEEKGEYRDAATVRLSLKIGNSFSILFPSAKIEGRVCNIVPRSITCNNVQPRAASCSIPIENIFPSCLTFSLVTSHVITPRLPRFTLRIKASSSPQGKCRYIHPRGEIAGSGSSPKKCTLSKNFIGPLLRATLCPWNQIIARENRATKRLEGGGEELAPLS